MCLQRPPIHCIFSVHITSVSLRSCTIGRVCCACVGVCVRVCVLVWETGSWTARPFVAVDFRAVCVLLPRVPFQPPLRCLIRQTNTAQDLVAEASLRVSAEVAGVVQLPRFGAEFVRDMYTGGLLVGGVANGSYDHVPAILMQQHGKDLTQVVRGACAHGIEWGGVHACWTLCTCRTWETTASLCENEGVQPPRVLTGVVLAAVAPCASPRAGAADAPHLIFYMLCCVAAWDG